MCLSCLSQGFSFTVQAKSLLPKPLALFHHNRICSAQFGSNCYKVKFTGKNDSNLRTRTDYYVLIALTHHIKPAWAQQSNYILQYRCIRWLFALLQSYEVITHHTLCSSLFLHLSLFLFLCRSTGPRYLATERIAFKWGRNHR